MDFKQLRSFVAVVEYENFSKAAEKLFISQPTISVHIRQLEEELQTSLVLRTTKSIAITRKGMELYQYAVRILELCDRMVQVCQTDDRQIISLGASTIPATYILPKALPAYGQTHKDTYFSMHQADSKSVIDGVLEGRFDLGFVGAVKKREGLSVVPICRNQIIAITPVNDHYLKMQKESAGLEALLKEPMILRERGSQKSANTYLDKMGISEESLHTVARVNDQETIKNLVSGGMGISLISEIAARDFLAQKRLLKFELPEQELDQYIYLVYTKQHAELEWIQDFIAYMTRFEVL